MRNFNFMALLYLKHVMSVMTLMGFIVIVYEIDIAVKRFVSTKTFSLSAGYASSFMSFFSHIIIIIKLPINVCNFLGVVLINNFEEKPRLKRSLLDCPFLCLRVVTKGIYPELVHNTVQRNLQTCKNLGLKKFVIQVVSDKSVNLSTNDQISEIVVPVSYKTKNCSFFKSRALQYALEPHVDILKPGDWIVHLDEETLLTEDALIGIINFAGATEHSIGQGHIIYNNGHIVNWITTLADSFRVGIDYGCRRFCLSFLHTPVFGFKGSFIVVDAEVEKYISFDFGPEGSIAEDCFFASIASSKGITFGFVEGIMIEQSTFTVHDFVKQRRRWMYGIFLTARNHQIPIKNKLGPILISLANFLPPLIFFLSVFSFRLSSSPHLTICSCFITGTNYFLFILGTIKSFDVMQLGFLKGLRLILATFLCSFLPWVVEYWNSVLVFWMPRNTMKSYEFHIVNKELGSKKSSKVELQ